MPKKIPSSLSKKPPCPGKKLPVSFIFAFLFKKENNRSPDWQATDIIRPTKNIFSDIVLV